MYDDRICISSAGGLENGETLEKIIKNPTSRRRNPLICDIFSRLDYMERRGSGILKINKAYESDIKKSKVEVIGEIFFLTLYSRLYKDETFDKCRRSSENDIQKGKKKPQNLILEYIRKNGKKFKRYIMENLDLTEGQIKYTLKSLKEKRKIESIGNGKATYYIIIKEE